MKAWIIAAALTLTSAVGAAYAQRGDAFVGTWAFQTEPYGNEQFGVIMSGAAVITRASAGRYSVRLLANERVAAVQTGDSQLLIAHQTCTGEADAAQLTITCTLTEAPDGYQPDNFVLQQGESGQLVGVLTSASNPQVTFTRVR